MTLSTLIRNEPADPAVVRERLTRMATVLDSAIAIPGTRLRLGLDPVIGLIPGIGDAIGLLLGLWMLWQARSVKAPADVQLKMLGNLGIEAVLGAVPLLGDAFDLVWQANQRNRHLLLRWLDEHTRPAEPPTPRLALWHKLLILGLLLALVVLLLV